MVIYNLTIKVDWSISHEWLKWMKEIHIPEVMQSGCFTKNQLVRILQIDEEEGPTYAIQFYAPSLTKYDEYLKDYAPALRQDSFKKWGDKFLAFRTLMQVEE